VNTIRPAVVLIVAVICLAALEGYALYLGMNGTLFALTIGLIGSIAGVSVGKIWGRSVPVEKEKPGERE
jgi:hypothetical protein